MRKMTVSLQWYLMFFTVLFEGIYGLRDVVLTIEPKIVQRLHKSTLKCTYDLEGATLYSVKWYRGKYEFYRYTPSEHPPSKVFPFGGIRVDINSSNSTQVVLTDIEFNLAGKFSCEVTTTEEPASTGTDTKSMIVVQLPEYPPVISVGRAPLDYGDTLRANCTSPPARPAANLKFFLNNLTVARTDPSPTRKTTESQWSDLSLELKLKEFHFDNGRLVLRCVAQIGDVYHEEAELLLESARDPIPERGELSLTDDDINLYDIFRVTVSAFSSASIYPSNNYLLQLVVLFYTRKLISNS